MRQLARELTDTLRVIAYADTTEAYIQDAYLRFMDLLKEEAQPAEEIGQTCEDILYGCLTRYM